MLIVSRYEDIKESGAVKCETVTVNNIRRLIKTHY